MSKDSETLTEHVMAPWNSGVTEGPDLTGHAGTLGRGAFLLLFLKVQGDRIASGKGRTDGRGPTIAACYELTTEMSAHTRSKDQSCPILTLPGIHFTVLGEPEVVRASIPSSDPPVERLRSMRTSLRSLGGIKLRRRPRRRQPEPRDSVYEPKWPSARSN